MSKSGSPETDGGGGSHVALDDEGLGASHDPISPAERLCLHFRNKAGLSGLPRLPLDLRPREQDPVVEKDIRDQRAMLSADDFEDYIRDAAYVGSGESPIVRAAMARELISVSWQRLHSDDFERPYRLGQYGSAGQMVIHGLCWLTMALKDLGQPEAAYRACSRALALCEVDSPGNRHHAAGLAVANNDFDAIEALHGYFVAYCDHQNTYVVDPVDRWSRALLDLAMGKDAAPAIGAAMRASPAIGDMIVALTEGSVMDRPALGMANGIFDDVIINASYTVPGWRGHIRTLRDHISGSEADHGRAPYG